MIFDSDERPLSNVTDRERDADVERLLCAANRVTSQSKNKKIIFYF